MQSETVFVSTLLCLLFVGQGSAGLKQSDEYALVIDAGSSGSRIHVYKYSWNQNDDRSFPTIELPDKKFKITPGLSSFASKPQVYHSRKDFFLLFDRVKQDAGDSLKGLITFAEENVPEEYRNSTLLALSATAGLRMVSEEAKNQILDSCFSWLSKNSPFIVRRDLISVISGEEGKRTFQYSLFTSNILFLEGAYGWLSVNFLHGELFISRSPRISCRISRPNP